MGIPLFLRVFVSLFLFVDYYGNDDYDDYDFSLS